MLLGNVAATTSGYRLQQQGRGPPSFDSWNGQTGGGYAAGYPWPAFATSPWGEHSWGAADWYGGQYQLVFPSFPAFGSDAGPEDPGQQAASTQAASSSSPATGFPAPSTSSPGRVGAQGVDPPAGDGEPDPWLDAARSLVNTTTASRNTYATTAGVRPEAAAAPLPPDLPQPAMQGVPRRDTSELPPPVGNMNFPGGLQQPPGLNPQWNLGPGNPWSGMGPSWSPAPWAGAGTPWAPRMAGTPDVGPPGVWKGEFSDPPAWPGWQYRRQWVAAVRRWDKVSDIPVGRRAERVLRTLGWEMATEFEHLTEVQLAAPNYLDKIIEVIEMKAGAREDDDRRAAFRAVLHDNGRRKDETMGQYANRRLRDFTRASSFGIQLPSEFRAALLREGAGLNEQGLQNLTALMQGQDHDVDKLAHTLARLDVRHDRISGFSYEGIDRGRHHPTAGDFYEDVGAGEDDYDESDSPDDMEILEELSDMNFTENRAPRHRRTWKENKKFKAELRKDRKGFTKGGTYEGRGDAPRNPSRPPGGRHGISCEQLKKVSRCNLCGRRGHWAEDCRQGTGQGRPASGDGAAKVSGFCYLGGSLVGASSTTASHFHFMTYVTSAVDGADPKASWSFLTIPSGMAILDIGATQDIIGKTAFRALEHELSRCGLQTLEVPTTASSPTGIGGVAKVMKTALVPISPGGVPGVIQFLVIDGEIPPLLSVGLLEHLGASLDLNTNEVSFKKIGVDMRMTNLPSGHRAIPLVQWQGGPFPVPPAAREQFGLGEGAFAKECSSPSAYMKQGSSERSEICADCGQAVYVSTGAGVNSSVDARVACRRTSSASVSRATTASSSPACTPHEQPANPVSDDFVRSPMDSGSIAPMGNCSTRRRLQFDSPAAGRNGSTISIDGGGSGRGEWPSRTHVARTGHEDVLCPGDHQGELPPSRGGGDPPEERAVGAQEVPDCGRPGANDLLACGHTYTKSKSVRFLDSVPEVFGSADIPSSRDSAEGKGQSTQSGSQLDRPAGELPSVSNDSLDSGTLSTPGRTPGGSDPGRVECYSPGDGHEFPRGGPVASRAGEGTGTDAVHHAEQPSRQRPGEHVRHPDLGACGEERRGDDGDGGRRLTLELGSGGKPEPPRPSMRYWPRWISLPAVSLSSTLLSWAQLQADFRTSLITTGGDQDCWMLHQPLPVHHGVPRRPDSPTAPSWLAWPWTTVTTGKPPDGYVVRWHELRGSEEVISRGAGDLSTEASALEAPTTTTWRWSVPRKINELLAEMDSDFLPRGFSEEGETSATGPYWVIRAPGLRRVIEDQDVATGEGHHEDRAAESSLTQMSRQQRRETLGSHVDFVELFGPTAALNAVIHEGLRVPASHESFVDKSGWKVEEKRHRQRFRRYLHARRPITVAMTLPTRFRTTETTSSGASFSTTTSGSENVIGENVPARFRTTETTSSGASFDAMTSGQDTEGWSREQVRDQLAVHFAIEVASEQVARGRVFYLQASTRSSIWQAPAWNELLQKSDAQVHQDTQAGVRVATNSSWLPAFTAPSEDKTTSKPSCLWSAKWDEMDDGEKLAYRLRQEGDFTFSSCLQLLRSTTWPHQRRRRRSVKDPSTYQVLGQYSYGKFSGMTLGTYKLRHTTLYLNDFMTYHGAEGARSTLSVTCNARVTPHRDVHNIGENYCIAFGPYRGGELWLEDERGGVPREVRDGVCLAGTVHRHRERMNVFDPKKYHAVSEWTGERWSITAFQTRSSVGLSREQAKHLESYGFSLQGYQGSPLGSRGSSHAICQMATSETIGVTARESFPTSTSIDAVAQEPEEQSDDEAPNHETNSAEAIHEQAKVTQAQKKLVLKVHNNTGHPPKDRFLRTMRAAGALPQVLRYIRDEFRCETCEAKRGPDHRRRAQCPRVHGFNRVLSMDVFYLPFKGESTPILNVVDHGTGYQLACRISGSGSRSPSAAATWRAFVTTWVRFLGPPSMIITDGGKEFQQRFERGVEQLGVLHHVTAPESRWQNSRAERHGGWLKQRLTQELDSGQGIAETIEDVDELLASVVAAKNRWFNSGGYTPVQLVFGELPRIPGDLLSQDSLGQQVISDGFHDPSGLGEMGAEFRKSAAIRERGRQLALAETSREAIRRAVATSSTPSRTWSPGQWVYCFRRGKIGDNLHPTSRWVGPGIVVLQSKSVVFVAMRSRLWRCSPEQLRSAFPSEVLGRQLATDPEMAELLRKVISGNNAGAVDITREGPPDEGQRLAPVEAESSGEAL